jgi:hypothetical protein
LHLCKITEKVAGLEISRDASRKAIKVHPLQINTRTNFYLKYIYIYIYIYIYPTLTYTLLLGSSYITCKNPLWQREPNNYFWCFSSLQNTRLAAVLFWTAATTLLKYERQGHSFPTRYNNTHMYTIHTHTLCLSFSPEFQFQKPAWVVLIVTPEYQSHNMLIYTCTASLIEYLSDDWFPVNMFSSSSYVSFWMFRSTCGWVFSSMMCDYGMKSEVCWRPSFFNFAHIL